MATLPPPSSLGFRRGLQSVPAALGLIRRRPRILLRLIPPLAITLLLDGVVVFLVFGWSAFVMGFSFFTIPAGRSARRLSDRVALARRHPEGMIGLGAVVAVVALVPFLNILCVPVFVIAGTLLYLEARAWMVRAATMMVPDLEPFELPCLVRSREDRRGRPRRRTRRLA